MKHIDWTLAPRAEVFPRVLLPLILLFVLLLFLLLRGALGFHIARQLGHGEMKDMAAEAVLDAVLHVLLEDRSWDLLSLSIPIMHSGTEMITAGYVHGYIGPKVR